METQQERRSPLSKNQETEPLQQQREEQESVTARAQHHHELTIAGDADEGDDRRRSEAADSAAAAAAPVAVLTDDLRDQIVRQVEYYFSDENLPNDKFLLKFVKSNKKGSVPISVIASFRRMKKLVQDLSLVEVALRSSSQLVVSVNGKTVRRINPLPIAEVKDTKSHTVMVENLPNDYSTDSLQKIFGSSGKIVNITIHDPHSTEESATTKKTENTISNKLHALIEYQTAEAAENAVATLNDEKNWRNGLRVELLHKWMGKYRAYARNQRGLKEALSEKNDNQTSETPSNGQKTKSDGHHDEKAEREGEEVLGGKGRRKGRYRSQGRSQQSANGQGHGHVPSGASYGISKTPPGPRMPDGTRGFTMGRGKSVVSEPNPHDV